MSFKNIIFVIFSNFLKEYEFVVKSESESFIEYEHNLFTICFTYDLRNSFEVDVTFTEKNSDLFYSYKELKEILLKIDDDTFAFQAKDESTIQIWANEVKDFLITNLKVFIKNNSLIFYELKKNSEKKSIEYFNTKEIDFFTKEFNNLWLNKQYLKLIKLSDENFDKLQGILKKKYEYSMKIIENK